jgi:hypothetical protein
MDDLKSVETTRQDFKGQMQINPRNNKEEMSVKYNRHGRFFHVLGRHYPITFRTGEWAYLVLYAISR